MRWAILRFGKQESGAIVHSSKPLPAWSSIQAGRTRICWRNVRNLLTNCLKNACTWHDLDDLTFNKLTRSVAKWTQACDRPLARLISCIHHTNDFRLYCHVGNKALQTGFVSILRLCWRSWGSKSTSGGVLVFWEAEHLSQSVGCARNKLLSRTAPQSLKSLLWMLDYVWMGYLLLIIGTWWLRCYVQPTPKHTSHQETGAVLDSKTKTQHVKRRRKLDVDYVPITTHSFQGKSQLYSFEDNGTVIKMKIKGRSPTMRHVSRTHRVALDWLFERINLEPKIQINFVDTKNQLADIPTNGSFSKNEWNHLLCLFNAMSFSRCSCSHFKSFLSKVR